MTQLSFPVNKRPFSVSDWRYVIGDEPGIKEDVNGTSYDLTFSTNSDVAYLGSPSQDSVSEVGGGGHVIPAGQTHGITVPPATGQPRTDLLVIRYDPAWAVLPVDPAVDPVAAAAHVGPCRLHRIAGAEGGGLPAYDSTPPGVEDLVMWEVTRTPGQPLAAAARKDRRIRKGPNLSVAMNADRPQGAPLGTHVRVLQTGIDYWRQLDGQGAPDWVPGAYHANGGVASPMLGTGLEFGQPLQRKWLNGQVPTATTADGRTTIPFPGGGFSAGVAGAVVSLARTDGIPQTAWTIQVTKVALTAIDIHVSQVVNGTPAFVAGVRPFISGFVEGW